jgi:hypothetical protein
MACQQLLSNILVNLITYVSSRNEERQTERTRRTLLLSIGEQLSKRSHKVRQQLFQQHKQALKGAYGAICCSESPSQISLISDMLAEVLMARVCKAGTTLCEVRSGLASQVQRCQTLNRAQSLWTQNDC